MDYTKAFHNKQIRLLNSFNVYKSKENNLEKSNVVEPIIQNQVIEKIGVFSKLSDNDLKSVFKTYQDIMILEKSLTKDQQQLLDHALDLKAEIKLRANNLEKSQDYISEINKSKILSVYGKSPISFADELAEIQKSADDAPFGTETFELDIDSIKPELIKSIQADMIKKSFEVLESGIDLLNKGMGKAGLHPQKVTIHSKDGGTYQAIR